MVANRYCSTLEEADLKPETYDLLYSFYVFEHVLDPECFLAAASRCLKPGGSLFFITPNGNHYFSYLASFLAKINMQHRLLRMLRPAELVDSYHYPAVYKLNRPKEIERIARAVGFDAFEYRYSERLDDVIDYFPGVTKVLPRLWENAAAHSGRDDLLVNLMGKMVKRRI